MKFFGAGGTVQLEAPTYMCGQDVHCLDGDGHAVVNGPEKQGYSMEEVEMGYICNI